MCFHFLNQWESLQLEAYFINWHICRSKIKVCRMDVECRYFSKMSYWYWDSGAVAVRGVEERKLPLLLVMTVDGRCIAVSHFSVTLPCRTYATEGSGISFLKCQSPLWNIESEEHNRDWWKHTNSKHLRIWSIWFWWASKNNNTKKLSVVLLGVMILTDGFHHPESRENRRSWSQIVEVEWSANGTENAASAVPERTIE